MTYHVSMYMQHLIGVLYYLIDLSSEIAYNSGIVSLLTVPLQIVGSGVGVFRSKLAYACIQALYSAAIHVPNVVKHRSCWYGFSKFFDDSPRLQHAEMTRPGTKVGKNLYRDNSITSL